MQPRDTASAPLSSNALIKQPIARSGKNAVRRAPTAPKIFVTGPSDAQFKRYIVVNGQRVPEEEVTYDQLETDEEEEEDDDDQEAPLADVIGDLVTPMLDFARRVTSSDNKDITRRDTLVHRSKTHEEAFAARERSLLVQTERARDRTQRRMCCFRCPGVLDCLINSLPPFL